MKEVQQLRCIALKLGVSGTALPISETRLYKGSYGFVKLRVYVPKTQNTEAPLCTAFCTTTNELGREKISSKNYNLIYVGECDLEGKTYLLFESLLPKEFTQKETSPNGLKITFNYFDTAITTDESGEAILDENGVPKHHATDLLVSSTYTTTVYSGGWNNESVELNINSSEAAQINENTRNISVLQDDVLGLQTETRAIRKELKETKDTAKRAEITANGLADSIAKANDTAQEASQTAVLAKERVNDLEEKVKAGGTVVKIAGVAQTSMSFKQDPQSQIDEIQEQIVNGVGGSAYKGDFIDAEEMLLALMTEHHLIYRIPQGYNLDNLSPFFEESNVSTELGGYVEFIGDVKIIGDINSNDAEIESVNICANLIDGSGRRITDNLNMNADDMLLNRQNVLSMNQAFFRYSEAFSNDITESGAYIIRIVELKIADGLYINPPPFLATFIVDAGSKTVYGGGVMAFLGNLFVVSYFNDTWYVCDTQGKEYTDMKAVHCEKLV